MTRGRRTTRINTTTWITKWTTTAITTIKITIISTATTSTATIYNTNLNNIQAFHMIVLRKRYRSIQDHIYTYQYQYKHHARYNCLHCNKLLFHCSLNLIENKKLKLAVLTYWTAKNPYCIWYQCVYCIWYLYVYCI